MAWRPEQLICVIPIVLLLLVVVLLWIDARER